jgi:16S rRNA A1518/A1519 N6-dimethyltransferase RsmA/KsgA/DIM1 with predicted DNA glycosylase/AP lyase activity
LGLLIDPEGHEIAALEALVRRLDGARVIEIGCGDGRLTRRYSARAASVLAIDPDESAIAAFRANPPPGGPIDVHALAVDRLEVPPRSADVVLLSWAL